MELYVARPARKPRGAVIVMQEAFGVTSHIADVVERTARAGYQAVAPALFHRTAASPLSYDDRPAVFTHLQALSQQGLLGDLDATLAALGAAGFEHSQVGIVGFCMGGSVTVLAASSYRLGAAVSFYGGGVREGRFGMPPLVELARELVTPWLGLYGEADEGIPMDDVDALRSAAGAAKVPTEVISYPGAQHGFHCDDRPAVFDVVAAAAAWERTLDWFAAYLGH